MKLAARLLYCALAATLTLMTMLGVGTLMVGHAQAWFEISPTAADRLFAALGALAEDKRERARPILVARDDRVRSVTLPGDATGGLGFHRTSPPVDEAWQDTTACNVCHSHLAHGMQQGKRFAGSVLNMHSGFLVCRGCHQAPDGGIGDTYRWVEPGGGVAKPPIPGTRYRLEGPGLDLARYGEVKLAPPGWQGSDPQRVEAARRFVDEQGALTEAERKKRLAVFHDPLGKPLRCADCHDAAPGAGMDFASLGFSGSRAAELSTGPWVRVVTGSAAVDIQPPGFLGR